MFSKGRLSVSGSQCMGAKRQEEGDEGEESSLCNSCPCVILYQQLRVNVGVTDPEGTDGRFLFFFFLNIVKQNKRV